MVHRSLRTLLAALLFAAALLAVWGAAAHFDVSSAEDAVALARAPIAQLGSLGVLVVLGAAAVVLVALVPSPLVYGACGLMLGSVGGVAVATLALGAAVLLDRAIGATVLGAQLRTRLAAKHPRVDAQLQRLGLPGLIMLRALGTPPALVGWASAATTLPWWKAPLACMVGTIPRGIAYAALGAAGASLLQPSQWTAPVYASMGALVIVGLATGLLALRSRPAPAADPS